MNNRWTCHWVPALSSTPTHLHLACASVLLFCFRLCFRLLFSVVVVGVVVVGVVFAEDISGLGRLVVLTVETRSQKLFRALAGGLGAAGGAVVEQPHPAVSS